MSKEYTFITEGKDGAEKRFTLVGLLKHVPQYRKLLKKRGFKVLKVLRNA